MFSTILYPILPGWVDAPMTATPRGLNSFSMRSWLNASSEQHLELIDAGPPLLVDREPCAFEEAHHRPVIHQHLRREPEQSFLSSQEREVAQELSSQAPLLILVAHDE